MVQLKDGTDLEMRRLIDEDLQRQYLTAVIVKIPPIEVEGHTSYWTIEPNRGAREFVLNDLNENVCQPRPHYMVITDVHESRFLIPDTTVLDALSRKNLDTLF